MIQSDLPRYILENHVLNDLLATINKGLTIVPKTGSDGIHRLQKKEEGPFPKRSLQAFIPAKKVLIPDREAVWSYKSGRFNHVEGSQQFTVIGLPLCDLQAIWYLDQVFISDEHYQGRRAQTLLVGMPCKPDSDCRCERLLMPVAGDLFIDENRVWALSLTGETLLKSLGCFESEKVALPWPKETEEKRPMLTEKQFNKLSHSSIWEKEAKRCLSCGACSAVCPTCYCFDMHDTAAFDGSVTRNRTWDNCFFSEHGKVAGGHDFRFGRANRLRFRMEHKFFGFGELHNQNACVGCGRCRRACPVDIDLDNIAKQLVEEGGL